MQQGWVGRFDAAAGEFPEVAERGLRLGAVEEEEAWRERCEKGGGGEDAGADGEGGERGVVGEICGHGGGEGDKDRGDVDLDGGRGGHIVGNEGG